MTKSSEKKIVAGSLIVLALVFSIVAALTDCSAGGADNYAHFNIARWAFKYPHLFLDHWGKPVFTILIAPFTQLGLYGARLFNIIAGLTTAWICYLIALKWRIPKAWLAPVFVIFAPMYFVLMFTGMTEILFSLILILAIWLFFSERMILSAIAISFIILVRSEGFIFLPVFLAAFALKRRYIAIPFLLSGYLLFSIIGLIYYYHDFWWLFAKLPYVGGQGGIYGSGPWYHFLLKMPDYLGYLLILLFLVGFIFRIKDWMISKFKIDSDQFYQLFISGACFFGYLAAHSYVWWRGEMSLGLLRVMSGVTPIAGIFALIGYSSLESFIRSGKWKTVFLIATVLLVSIPGILKYKSAFKTDPNSEVIVKAVNWLRDSGNFKHHLIVHDPYIAFAAKVDAWDQQRLQYGFSDANQPELGMPDSSVFIWDAHFSQNEGRISAAKILENPYYELIAFFQPEVSFKVLGGYDYNVMIFRKVNERKIDNFQVLETLKGRGATEVRIYSDSLDFETLMPDKVNDLFRKKSSDSISNYYYQLGTECEFSPSFLLTDRQIEISNKTSFEVSFDFFPEEILLKNDALMVFSVEKNDKSYFYQGEDIQSFIKDAKNWNHASYHFYMPEDVKKDTKVKLYIWDVQKKNLKIDNFKVKVYHQK